MRAFTLFCVFFVAPALAHAESPALEIQEFSSLADSLERVVCVNPGPLSVRAEDLQRVVFTVKRGERVKPFQGWGQNQKTKVISGVRYSFVKVQFPEHTNVANGIGWVAEVYVKPRSACAGLPPLPVPPGPDTPITGLGDARCCKFPLRQEPQLAYDRGVGAFGASRSGGQRKHAACDLYHAKGDPILAVADGTVIRAPYYFYLGTYAVEVKHGGGFVVRYGEVNSQSLVQLNQKLKAGQTMAYMGKTTCCAPMLHFELYSGRATGPLTTRKGSYERRTDLLNPSAYLEKWQMKAFGR